MGEFWAAIAGAVIGGAIAFGIQIIALREARKERKEDAEARQRTLGHALIFKMIQIYSHLRLLNLHITEAIAAAKKAGFKGQLWQIVLPIVNSPDEIHFTIDEMVLLLSLKNDDLFNDIAAMDERHNATVAAFNAYAEHRLKLTALMPSVMNGVEGTAELTSSQRLHIEPKMVEVNSIIQSLVPQCQSQERETWGALLRLRTLLASKIGLTLAFEQKRDDELKSSPTAT